MRYKALFEEFFDEIDIEDSIEQESELTDEYSGLYDKTFEVTIMTMCRDVVEFENFAYKIKDISQNFLETYFDNVSELKVRFYCPEDEKFYNRIKYTGDKPKALKFSVYGFLKGQLRFNDYIRFIKFFIYKFPILDKMSILLSVYEFISFNMDDYI